MYLLICDKLPERLIIYISIFWYKSNQCFSFFFLRGINIYKSIWTFLSYFAKKRIVPIIEIYLYSLENNDKKRIVTKMPLLAVI